jgi:hypothetical protein
MSQKSLCSFDPALKKRMFKVKYLNGNKKIIHYVNAYDISEVKFQYKDFKIIELNEVK